MVHTVVVEHSQDFTFQPINHFSRLAYYSKLSAHFEIHIVDFLEKSTVSEIFPRPKAGSSNLLLRSVQELTSQRLLLYCDRSNDGCCFVYDQTSKELRRFGHTEKAPEDVFDVKINGPYVYIYCYNLTTSDKMARKTLDQQSCTTGNIGTTGTVYLYSRES